MSLCRSMIYILITISMGKPFIAGVASRVFFCTVQFAVNIQTSFLDAILVSAAAGMDSWVDNQPLRPTSKMQACMIADALLYVS